MLRAKQKRTIPSSKRGIQIWFTAPLDRVVFPFVAQRGYFESLVVFHRRSSPTATCREDCGKSTVQTTILMNQHPTYVAVPLKKAVATRPSSQERLNFRKFSSVKRSLFGHGVSAVVVSDTKQTPAKKNQQQNGASPYRGLPFTSMSPVAGFLVCLNVCGKTTPQAASQSSLLG